MQLLFFFSDTGGGHRASAGAVREALQRRHHAALDVKLVDVFKALPWPFPQIPNLWPVMVKLQGIPWSLFYRLTNHRTITTLLAHVVWPYIAPALETLLKTEPADAIVSFHPAINDVLGLAHPRLDSAPPLISVSQDLVNVHAATFTPTFAHHVVPTMAARERALRWGIAPERVSTVGVPTRSGFHEQMDLPQTRARARLELPLSGPIVLFVGGCDGIGPLMRVVQAVMRRSFWQERPHLVVITGHNRRLYHRLKRMSSTLPLLVKGYVQRMALWMRAADLLVTKAGPNTLAEACISACPMVLYTAIPGQESGNVRYVVDGGAGVWAPHPARAARSVQALLGAPTERRLMATRARQLARPHAADQIAELVRTLAQHPPRAPDA